MPYEPSVYAPSWVELSVVVGGFALVGLFLALFVKVFPVISMWEMGETREAGNAAGGTGR
jgi:Ni/Fe-hydrogenase subunit HybB-like protein